MFWVLCLIFPLLSGCTTMKVGNPPVSERTLCDVLYDLEPGEQVDVLLSGIYQVAPEAQVFFDPKQPECEFDLQPVTWVAFARGIGDRKILKERIEVDGRARVVFSGTLYGPGVIGPDEPDLPFAAAHAARVAATRYGHLRSYRTQFVVESILAVEPAREDDPWVWGGRPESLETAPAPIRLDVPQYPPIAQELGITGDVMMEVRVESGLVIPATLIDGDRLLAREAEKNLLTWRFDPNFSGDFLVTFSYRLEWRRKEESQAERVVMALPASVLITAARRQW